MVQSFHCEVNGFPSMTFSVPDGPMVDEWNKARCKRVTTTVRMINLGLFFSSLFRSSSLELVLFVVADGINKTGALDWYMGKLLGRPKNVASAQVRLMVPVAIVSAFLNNTPVVAVMIPIVQRWAKNNHLSAQQLLIPLSFASILGGTCTCTCQR